VLWLFGRAPLSLSQMELSRVPRSHLINKESCQSITLVSEDGLAFNFPTVVAQPFQAKLVVKVPTVRTPASLG